MPYEYRKLSLKEREEIVNYRRMQGYPLHAPPHPFREAGAYLISAANYEHRAIMSSPNRRTEFEALLLKSIREITEEFIMAFNYIHYNPVKHGYVSDPYDWPWLSLQLYYEDKGKDWLQEQWQAYKPPHDFGKGWDDDARNDYTCPGGRC